MYMVQVLYYSPLAIWINQYVLDIRNLTLHSRHDAIFPFNGTTMLICLPRFINFK